MGEPHRPSSEELATREIHGAQTASVHTQGVLHMLTQTCDKAGLVQTEYEQWAVLWLAQTAPEVGAAVAALIGRAARGGDR
jgi:hypothetical protein